MKQFLKLLVVALVSSGILSAPAVTRVTGSGVTNVQGSGVSNTAITAESPTDPGSLPAFRSVAATTYASRSSPTTINKPSGAVDGDLLIAVLMAAKSASTSTITGPAGWTLQTGFPQLVYDGSFEGAIYVWTKVAASEGASWNWTYGGGAQLTDGLVVAVSNPGTSSPQITLYKGTGSTTTTPGLTTTLANDLVIYTSLSWAGTGSMVVPTGSTPTFSEDRDLAGSTLYLAHGTLAAAGATSNKTQANGGTAPDPWAGMLIAMSPAPTGIKAQALLEFNGITATPATTANMNSGTVGVTGTWGAFTPATPTGFNLVSGSQRLLSNAYVNGATYAAGNTNNNRIGVTNSSGTVYAQLTPPQRSQIVTVSGWFTAGAPSNGNQLYDLVGFGGATTGGFSIFQLRNLIANYSVNIESDPGGVTTHSTDIVITQGSTYWFSFRCNWVAGTCDLYIYTTAGVLVGNVSSTQRSGEFISNLRIGNAEVGNGTGTNYFENVLINWFTAPQPMGP